MTAKGKRQGVLAEGYFDGIDRIEGRFLDGPDRNGNVRDDYRIAFRIKDATLTGTTGPLVGRKVRIVVEEIPDA